MRLGVTVQTVVPRSRCTHGAHVVVTIPCKTSHISTLGAGRRACRKPAWLTNCQAASDNARNKYDGSQRDHYRSRLPASCSSPHCVFLFFSFPVWSSFFSKRIVIIVCANLFSNLPCALNMSLFRIKECILKSCQRAGLVRLSDELFFSDTQFMKITFQHK